MYTITTRDALITGGCVTDRANGANGFADAAHLLDGHVAKVTAPGELQDGATAAGQSNCASKVAMCGPPFRLLGSR
jgi:hypothetical protein